MLRSQHSHILTNLKASTCSTFIARHVHPNFLSGKSERRAQIHLSGGKGRGGDLNPNPRAHRWHVLHNVFPMIAEHFHNVPCWSWWVDELWCYWYLVRLLLFSNQLARRPRGSAQNANPSFITQLQWNIFKGLIYSLVSLNHVLISLRSSSLTHNTAMTLVSLCLGAGCRPAV